MPRPARPVVVVGADLAALAGAVRLAKLGYGVTLLPDGEPLGAEWASGPNDHSPRLLSFPAPWRDLFRKSGRTLEDELARDELALVPAESPLHRFADGSELRLGTRAESHQAITTWADEATAESWQRLVDALGAVWQQLRFLGLETELRGPTQLTPAVRADVWAGRSLADLAADLPDPRLGTLVSALADEHGSPADQVPAWAAVSLFVERTFGHWRITDRSGADLQMSVLATLLERRLDLRKVDVRPDLLVAGPALSGRRADTRVDGVELADGHHLRADAVLVSQPPWLWHEALPTGRWSGLPAEVRREAAGVARCRPANPVGRGVVWSGFDSWADRPPAASALPGLYFAGPWSRSGAGPWREILSAALAAGAIDRRLG